MKHDRTMRPFDVRKIDSKRSLTLRSEPRVSGMFGVRAVGEQREHAAIAVGGERVKVEGLAVDGCRIDLEVAGVDDGSGRSL